MSGGRLTVYIVISAHWEESEIIGVYRTSLGAKATHPGDWVMNKDGSGYVRGLARGDGYVIERYKVKA